MERSSDRRSTEGTRLRDRGCAESARGARQARRDGHSGGVSTGREERVVAQGEGAGGTESRRALRGRRRRRPPPPTTDRRTPEERLEAMVREDNPDRAHRMFGRILDDLDAKPEPGPWISAARTLSERLVISDDAFYYFVEKLTECLVLEGVNSDPELVRIMS